MTGESELSSDEIFFSEDPFADDGVEIISNSTVNDITTTDLTGGVEQSKLVEVDPASIIVDKDEVARLNSELQLTSLQARILAEELSRLSTIEIGDPIHTMGEQLRVNLITQNPFGDVIELRPPTGGLVFEFNWTIERWGALTGSDKVQRHGVFRYPDWFVLEPGESFIEHTILPLEVDGAQGAVWVVNIDARIRCVGAMQGEKSLPVHEIEYTAARFLVLPPGWQQFSDVPLESLRRVLELNSQQADLHIMVCCALLKSEQRNEAVYLLIEKLRTGNDPHRALSVTQALSWLTGRDLGSLPHVWLEWAEQFNL
ncbi:MAG: hypothetical protein ACI84O_001277 [Myxococcota bacterium]|jgi:hypothetical protein